MERIRSFLIAFCLTILPLPILAAASPEPSASSANKSALQTRADQFLTLVNSSYHALYKVNNEAQWNAMADVKPEHDAASQLAGKAYAAFNGNPAVISEARALLEHSAELDPLSVRELNQVLLNA